MTQNQAHLFKYVDESGSQVHLLMTRPDVLAKRTSCPVLVYVDQMPNKPSGKE